MMRLTAGFFIYLLLVSSILSLTTLGLYLILSPTNEYAVMVNALLHNHYVSNIVGVVCIVLAAVIACAGFCFRDRIKLASSIVKVSSRFVN